MTIAKLSCITRIFSLAEGELVTGGMNLRGGGRVVVLGGDFNDEISHHSKPGQQLRPSGW
jgi:hypothetical protein